MSKQGIKLGRSLGGPGERGSPELSTALPPAPLRHTEEGAGWTQHWGVDTGRRRTLRIEEKSN